MRYVKFYSRQAAQSVTSPHYVISIGEKGDNCKLHPKHKAVLRLEFDDIPHHIPGYKMFSTFQAKQIIRFAEQVPDGEILIVHCEAGISRSAAVAQFLIKDHGFTLKTDRLCNGKFNSANGRVYGMLRTVNLDRSDLEAFLTEQADNEEADRTRGVPQW